MLLARSLAAAPQQEIPQFPLAEHKLLNQHVATHAFGPPGPIVTDAAGEVAILAEGGALAFVPVDCQELYEEDILCGTSTLEPAKRSQVSSFGVVPVDMLLDPDADFSDSQAPNRIYIAGGRDGLWVMDANPDPLVGNPATRIDDAWDVQDIPYQTSRRWCNAVEIIEIDGTYWCFVADHGGSVLVYDITDILQEDPGEVLVDEHFEIWTPPLSLTDTLPCNVFDVALDRVQWVDGEQQERDELYVYVSVRRVGIVALRFDPAASAGSRLQTVALTQTPGLLSGLRIREHPTSGERTLVVADSYGGLHLFEYSL